MKEQNCVTKTAEAEDRDYITPEDVSEAILNNDIEKVRLDVLAVLGSQTEFGAEDSSLCAFVAWQGKES